MPATLPPPAAVAHVKRRMHARPCPPRVPTAEAVMVLQGRAVGVAARQHRGQRQPRSARRRPGGGAGALLLWLDACFYIQCN